jgi:translocation and assembly module TamA
MNGFRGTRFCRVGHGLALVSAFVVSIAPVEALAEVEINGIEGELLSNVLVFLDIDDLACDAPSVRINGAMEEARAQIRRGVEAYGYYSVAILADLVHRDECWLATFAVTLGQRVLLRNVVVELTGEARNDPDFSAAVTDSGLTPGAPLVHSRYEDLKQSWRALSRDRGYMSAGFSESRIDVYPDELSADISLRFDSGPRYSFGEISIDQDILDDDLAAAYLSFRRGDPYDTRLIAESQIVLRDTGYFDGINVTPGVPDHERREVPLDVALIEAPRKLLSYGVGLSTDTGPRLRFARTIRRFNERGHQLGFNAQLSPVVSEVAADYRLPYGDPRFEWVSFDVGAKREDTDTSESDSLELGARRVLHLRNGWTRTQMLSFLIEDFEVGSQLGRARLLTPALEWSRLRADDSLRPDRGSKIDLELRAASDDLGSDTSFLQIVAGGKWIFSTPAAGRVLVRSQMGATSTDEFTNLPPSVRFFAGGDNSVRGYDFETLGPVNEAGEVIGGPNLFTASVEYEHPVRERWSVAVFYDTGNAFDDTNVKLVSGTGFGARWQSPLGPIRVDIAKPLDGIDRSLRLHISLGPDL